MKESETLYFDQKEVRFVYLKVRPPMVYATKLPKSILSDQIDEAIEWLDETNNL